MIKNLHLYGFITLVSFGCIHSQPDDIISLRPTPLTHNPEESKPVTPVSAMKLYQQLSARDVEWSPDLKDQWERMAEQRDLGNLAWEAALVLGLSLDLIHSHQFENTLITEEDLHATSAPISLANTPNLETLTEKYGLDLIAGIQSNPLLSNDHACSIIMKAHDRFPTSEEYAQRLAKSLEKIALRFQAIASLSPTPAPALIPEPETAEVAPNMIAPALSYGIGELQEGEDILETAQEMIDKRNFSDALALLQKVDDNHLLFATAQEMIKKTSNLAVQELRHEAAKSYKSAIPITDVKARQKYLLNARKHLEAALSQYPHADQIETVKQNLSVINKSLAATNQKKF